jgi:hypothetical protein
MTRLEALERCRDAVMSGTEERINCHGAFRFDDAVNVNFAYAGSLDAAQALHEAVLPGWPSTIENMNSGLSRAWTNKSRGLRTLGYIGENNSPARAWLIAILKALIAEERYK